MRGIVKECFNLSTVATEEDIAQATNHLLQVESKIAEGESRLSDLFGFEIKAKPRLREGLDELTREKARLKRLSEFGRFPCLNLEPFRWRNKNGWPKLALFSLDSATCEISIQVKARRNSWGEQRGFQYARSSSPRLPEAIASCYEDVFQALMLKAKEEKASVSLSTAFLGIMPDTVRSTIKEVGPAFEQIFLVVESKQWQMAIKKAPKPIPREADPLVVGFDGENFWIIASFDPTPLERMVKDWFSIT